ncbi:MAG: type II secretion system protein F [Chromatiales bacterium]|jgi:type IV pilus assembly protein PilC|nr:type II secretion system protein F [Chromatiales bacterium]MDP6151086.1 type II secretion system F family protein [Gammaproteobacteria bacterium]MDP7270018.1 type II secretion system F family protein [Gammaproteobacteria bacterium]HJP04767.1 type II secretion system F family protein [Gammaproteobacteria bacterium]
MAESIAVNKTPFQWEGTDSHGKKIKGKSTAASESAVRAKLRQRGIVASRVRKQSNLFKKTGSVKVADIAIFSRQLATMLTAGIPLVQSFDIIGNGHDNPAMQKLVLAVKADVEGGTSLADALARHPLHFDDLFVSLVAAGEQAGALESLLDKIATYKEKTEAIKKKIKKALFYPAAIMVVALIVTTILLIFVIPEFENLFQGFGADLPTFTRMVIDLSVFVRSEGIWLALGVGGVFGGYIYMKKRSKRLREIQDRIILKLPVIGPIIQKSCIARFARTLSTMFAAGVPLVEGLESVAGACGNIVYEIGVLEIKDEVATGSRLQQCMENTNLFPNMVIQMIAVGEESGSLDEMSSKVADFYEDDVDNAVDGLSSLLEPLIMAILGVLVGGLVVAMYLPIFKMGAVI